MKTRSLYLTWIPAGGSAPRPPLWARAPALAMGTRSPLSQILPTPLELFIESTRLSTTLLQQNEVLKMSHDSSTILAKKRLQSVCSTVFSSMSSCGSPVHHLNFYHFAILKNSNISKCSLLRFDRRGVNTLKQKFVTA